MTRYIAGVQQKYTQSGGVRPFGISTLIVGFDPLGRPALYQTDPSGSYSAWKANAIGRNSKTVRCGVCGRQPFPSVVMTLYVDGHVAAGPRLAALFDQLQMPLHSFLCSCCSLCREYLEKNYAETSGRETMKLALKALVEVVEGSSKNIEVAVVEKEGGLRFLAGENIGVAAGGACRGRRQAGCRAGLRACRLSPKQGEQCRSWASYATRPPPVPAVRLRMHVCVCVCADDEVDALVKELEEEKAAAAPQRPAQPQ